MFDILLLSLGIILLVIGLIGCVLPVLPGPPISFVALLLLHFTKWAQFQGAFLWTCAAIAVAVSILDHWIPIWGTKKFGGSTRGVWGAALGLLAGLFFGPLGVIVGPFIGALIGELSLHSDSYRAIKAAFGSFIGILAGVVLKLVVSGLFTWYFIKELIV